MNELIEILKSVNDKIDYENENFDSVEAMLKMIEELQD